MDVLWRIALLGGLSLHGSRGEAHRFRLQRAAMLLAYLALHPGRRYSREVLCELLWPEEEPEAARNRLRVTLASLRKQLEPPGTPFGAVLAAEGNGSVGLRAEAVETDVAQFTSLLHKGELAAAVEVYTGELLPGLYETWVFEERERLQDAYLGALRRLAQERTEAGDTDGALEYLRRAAAIDPLSETIHAETIRLLVAAGRMDAAWRTFDQWERRLRDEMDTEPPVAIRDLLGEHPTRRPSPRRESESSRASATSPAAVTAPVSAPPVEMPASRPLPVYLTRFFGRDAELERLGAWLHDPTVRLITLSGIGGCGKTRLAVEIARRESERSEGARLLWFAPLADLWDARRIGEAIHQALALPYNPKSDPSEQATAYLQSLPGDPLLIFDNFEQLTPGGIPVIASLLQRVPRLTCLITSRHRMDLPGEQELPLSPLTVSTSLDSVLTAEGLTEAPGVRLFVDRAQAARPDFQVTPRNAADVAEICRMLEGIPLAVELVAARAGALSPAQIRTRLADGWDAPADRRARREDRHQSLGATLEWSYNLLAPELREFFSQLAVFRGGCDIDAAEAVCTQPLAMDFLARLRANSLLNTEERGGTLRFRMLETLRQWAQERAVPEEQVSLAERHAHFFCGRAETAEPHLDGPEQTVWREGLEADYANLLTALDWTEANEPLTGLRMAAALFPYWYKHGNIREGRERYATLLARVGEDAPLPLRSKALKGAGVLAFAQGDNEAALRYMEAGLEAARTSGDASMTASLLNNLGLLAWQQGDLPRAQRFIGEALEIRRAQKDRWNEASALLNLGAVARDRGEPARARQLFEESLAVCRETGDLQGLSRALNNLGNMLLAEDDLEVARRYYEESAATKRELGDHRGYAVSLHNLATIASRQGDYEQARILAEESLAVHRGRDDPRSVAFALNILGQIALDAGDPRRARERGSEALALRRAMNNPNDIGLSLYLFARLAYDEGRNEIAARLLAVSERLRTGGATILPPEERRDFDAFQAQVSTRLGSPRFAESWAAGESLSTEEAIDLALFFP